MWSNLLYGGESWTIDKKTEKRIKCSRNVEPQKNFKDSTDREDFKRICFEKRVSGKTTVKSYEKETYDLYKTYLQKKK